MLLPSIFLRTEAAERSRNLAEINYLLLSYSFISVTLAFRFKTMNITAYNIRGTYRGSGATAHELWSPTGGCNVNNEKISPAKVEELWWQLRENFLISCNKFMSGACVGVPSFRFCITNIICFIQKDIYLIDLLIFLTLIWQLFKLENDVYVSAEYILQTA